MSKLLRIKLNMFFSLLMILSLMKQFHLFLNTSSKLTTMKIVFQMLKLKTINFLASKFNSYSMARTLKLKTVSIVTKQKEFNPNTVPTQTSQLTQIKSARKVTQTSNATRNMFHLPKIFEKSFKSLNFIKNILVILISRTCQYMKVNYIF